MEARKGKSMPPPFPMMAQAFKVMLIGIIVLSAIFSLDYVKLSDYFPIKTVRVYGINRIDHQEVEDLLLPLINHGFFSINVDYIRDRLLQLPWVSDLYVERVWPDKVEIKLIERQAVASWNKESLLSDNGELFMPKRDTYPSHLPLFIGPIGKQILMLQYYNELSHLLTPLHASIADLELTPFLTWKITLSNGVILQMGHKDVLTRLSHFVKVYPKIVGTRLGDVDYIDLRYPNGVAIRWKS